LLPPERLRRVYLARLAQLHQRSDSGQHGDSGVVSQPVAKPQQARLTLSLAQLHQRSDSGQQAVIWNNFGKGFITKSIGTGNGEPGCPCCLPCRIRRCFCKALILGVPMFGNRSVIFASLFVLRMQRLPNLLATFRQGCALDRRYQK